MVEILFMAITGAGHPSLVKELPRKDIFQGSGKKLLLCESVNCFCDLLTEKGTSFEVFTITEGVPRDGIEKQSHLQAEKN